MAGAIGAGAALGSVVPGIGTAIGAGLGAITSLFGGLFGSNAAKKAGQAESTADTNAQNLLLANQNKALGLEGNFLNTEQQNEAPFLTAGQGAITSLSQLLGNGSLTAPSFVAPTAATETNDPGYQFRLSQGLNAVQNSAAARGGLLSGNTVQATNNYAQDYASNEFNNVYQRALNDYQLGIQNQTNTFNRYATLGGFGLTAAGQIGSVGTALTGQEANTLNIGGAEQAQAQEAAGQAQAAGIVGSTNALTQGISGAANDLGGYFSLSSLLRQQQQAQNQSGYIANDMNDPNNPLNYAQPMASGGNLRKGQVAIVGEQGPELFIPGHDGMVLPHRYYNRFKQMAA